MLNEIEYTETDLQVLRLAAQAWRSDLDDDHGNPATRGYRNPQWLGMGKLVNWNKLVDVGVLERDGLDYYRITPKGLESLAAVEHLQDLMHWRAPKTESKPEFDQKLAEAQRDEAIEQRKEAQEQAERLEKVLAWDLESRLGVSRSDYPRGRNQAVDDIPFQERFQ